MNKNTGQLYINSKGKLVEAKQLRPGFGECCKMECKKQITNEMRRDIFSGFGKMGDINLQRNYITRTVKKSQCHRSFTKEARRKNTY